jgi:hypothetical protein
MKRFNLSNLALFALVLFALGLVLIACATPPKEEMDKALDAVFRAESDPDAVAYAPLLLVRARDSLTRMQSEADSKNYDGARQFAAEAVNNAERAISDGRVAAARARDEASRVLSDIPRTLEETTNSVNNADGLSGLNGLSEEVDLARNTYDDAQQHFEDENYIDAISNAETVRSLLSDVNTRINGAAEAASRKK